MSARKGKSGLHRMASSAPAAARRTRSGGRRSLAAAVSPPSLARPQKLTKKHLDAMRLVKNGADIYIPRIARLLREVQKIDASLIEIGKPQMYRGDGTDVVPYFGAILTHQGKETLRYMGKERC